MANLIRRILTLYQSADFQQFQADGGAGGLHELSLGKPDAAQGQVKT